MRSAANSGAAIYSPVPSEYNHSRDEPVHFLQIWIEPSDADGAPGYEEKHFDVESKQGRLRLIASQDGRDGSVSLRQDAAIYASILNGDDKVEYRLDRGRNAYVHVARGRVMANGVMLSAGDAIKVTDEALVTLSKAEAAEVLLFDLPY